MSGDQSYVRPTETDIAGARRSHEHDAARFTPPERRAPVADVLDVDLSRDGGAITVRIYRPHLENVQLPTIVWYHGGGWTTGSLDTGDILARALCHGTPAVVASVEYRLAPEHPWPASVDDSTSALMWAADHIDELGRDQACIAVGGDSAGGNLAAVVAQTARENGVSLAAQILFYPFLGLEIDGATARYPSLEENAHGYYVTSADLHWCIDNYLPADDPTDPANLARVTPRSRGTRTDRDRGRRIRPTSRPGTCLRRRTPRLRRPRHLPRRIRPDTRVLRPDRPLTRREIRARTRRRKRPRHARHTRRLIEFARTTAPPQKRSSCVYHGDEALRTELQGWEPDSRAVLARTLAAVG